MSTKPDPNNTGKSGQRRAGRITAMLDEGRSAVRDVDRRQHRAGHILDPEALPFERPWDKPIVAAFLGTTVSGLDKLVKAGKAPPHFRSGRLMRWRPAVVRQWAENQEAAAAKST